MSDQPSVEQRLDRIESELAIRQLPVRYALATDSRDIDGWVRLFVPDVRVGRDASGRAALAAYTAPRLRAFRRSVHFVGVHQVSLDPADPDRATGAVYCRAEHEVDDQWIVMDICYFDEYRRVAGEWLFARRKAKHWYSADLLERPQAVGFNGWAHPRQATLPQDFPTWDGFWAGERPPRLDSGQPGPIKLGESPNLVDGEAMKPPPFEYHAASSAAEAISLLAEYGEDAKVLAGGQSLIPLLALRMSRPGHLIDINAADDLAGISGRDGLRCGALTRHRFTERSEAVRSASPLLSEAARFIGHAAIRNRGTIGGSIAHADPAAELPAVLLALDGEVEAVSARGSRRIAAAGFFLGYLTTALEPDELLTAVHFPPWTPGTGWSFTEFSRRSGDFGIIGVAATLRLDDRGTIAGARVAISGGAATAVRATGAEAALRGQHPGDGAWVAAAQDALAGLDLPEDLHGSAAYRRHLAASLIERALRSAYQRTPACQQLGVPA